MRGKRLPLLQPKDAADGAGDEILQADGLQAGGDAGAVRRQHLLLRAAEFPQQDRRVKGPGAGDSRQPGGGEGLVRAGAGGADGDPQRYPGHFREIHEPGILLLHGSGILLRVHGLHHQHSLDQLSGGDRPEDHRAGDPAVPLPGGENEGELRPGPHHAAGGAAGREESGADYCGRRDGGQRLPHR